MTNALSTTSEKSTYRRVFWRWTKFFGFLYMGILGAAMIFESQLVYPGAYIPVSGDVSQFDCEEVSFRSTDNTKLHGILFEAADPDGYVLYAHGNGEIVSHTAARADHLRRLHNVSIFLFEYRGFGKSEGKPHEKGILEDANAAQHWFANRVGIPSNQVVLWGRSLGGGVAVQAAAKNGARALVLENTFTSLVDTAKKQYPFLPVRLLMRNRFESIKKISEYDGPLFQSHGTADRVVPFTLGKTLFESATSRDKTFIERPGVGHNSPDSAAYEQQRDEFLRRVTRG